MKDHKPKALSSLALAVLGPTVASQIQQAQLQQSVRDTQLDESVRQANLVLARKAALKEAGEVLKDKLERNLKAAVDAFLGRELAEGEDLGERFAVWPDPETRPDAIRGVTFTIDDVPILWAGPMQIEDDGQNLTGNQQLLHHVPGVVIPEDTPPVAT